MSTPLLHWFCREQGRELASYDNESHWVNMHKKFATPWHSINLVKDWATVPIEDKHWGLVLVDQHPELTRKDSVLQAADHADFIVAHDSDKKCAFAYKYEEVFPLFKYRYDYKKWSPNTTVVSNFINVNKLGDDYDAGYN